MFLICRKLGDLSVDEFMAGDFESSETDSDFTSPQKTKKMHKQNIPKCKSLTAKQAR